MDREISIILGNFKFRQIGAIFGRWCSLTVNPDDGIDLITTVDLVLRVNPRGA